ncbi:MAG: glutamate ABC transporter substrate-binding protein [Actinomycetaceae bacterium]|nr:glutamate ABC transporter substrate-binding protein [Actinomycetaceae bacterium]
MKKLHKFVVLSVSSALALSLAACSAPQRETRPAKDQAPTATAPAKRVTVEEFDRIVAGGPVATKDQLAKSPWAQEIAKKGHLTLGGAATSPIFALTDVKTERTTGFDQGIANLLAHYILGGKAADVKNQVQLKNVSPDTRESMLQDGTVDTVLATYSITPERLKKINFAGPYYASGLSILVKADDQTTKSLDDLKGKKIAIQTGSTALSHVKEKLPNAEIMLFEGNSACVTAVKQGRVDAYVQDQSILLSAIAGAPGTIKTVGEPFTADKYGIGLSKDHKDAVEFVNTFLRDIQKDGSWDKLWKATVGPFIEGSAPQPPTIGDLGVK